MAVTGAAAAARAPVDDLFAGVAFTIINSPDLQEPQSSELISSLVEHGATHYPSSSSELHLVTHIISATIDFPAYNDALDGYINIVKPSWVEQSILRGRAANVRQFSPDPNQYLSDVVLTCANDIPLSDQDAIKGGLLATGGQYSNDLSKFVTHVIALTVDNDKCQTVIDKRLKCVNVLPHWFDDCLKLGKKIDTRPYVLPNPQILRRNLSSPVKWRVSEDVNGASTPAPDDSQLPLSPSKHRREVSVLRNKAVFLDRDLNLGPHLASTIEGLLKAGDAEIVEEVRRAEVVICQFRNSDAYRIASRAGKDVGNLSWLFYIINHNRYTSPTRRLLHYPVPVDGISGFKELVISVSNYTGEARVYLESLVRAAGGKFTKSMTQQNTHLITAHQSSEKCDAAREWGINVVNHLWLEESYSKCKMQPLTNTRYTHFPHRTNLGEVLGQTQIDRDATQKFYYPDAYDSPPGSPATNGQLEAVQSNNAGRRSKRDPQTPAVAQIQEGQENESPLQTTGRRAAKQRAAEKLRDQAPDIALFEKESKRVGGVIYGGRKVTDPDRVVLNTMAPGRKRRANGEEISSSNAPSTTEASEDEESDHETAIRKKSRTKAAQPTGDSEAAPLKVLVTGYEKWDNKTAKAADEKAKLRNIGIRVVDVAGKHDILVAPKMRRTRKFVAGIASATAVVDVNWLEKSIKRGERLPPEDFQLQDPEWENENAINVTELMKRAKANRQDGGLLREWLVFCTEGVHGGSEAYEEIIRANKGRFMLWKGRDTKLPRLENPPRGEVFLLSGEGQSDRALWPRFISNAKSQDFTPRIVKPDWLLTVATRQDYHCWDHDWLLWHEDDMETA